MYKELVKQLRSTVSRSKRTLFDDAADAIELLQKELREERHRHDRIQDFEVAEAEQLRQMRLERDMLAEKLREKESVLSLLRQGKQQWISVKDRLPEQCGMGCLLCATNGYNQQRVFEGFTGYMEGGKFQWHTNLKDINLDIWNVTHWMPLPELPEEG